MKPLSTMIHRPDLMKPPERPKPPTGLGDVVAGVAQPIAKFVDSLTGSKLAGCTPCQKRREFLNSIVPDITKPLK